MACTGAAPPGAFPGKRAGTSRAISTTAFECGLDLNTDSELIVTLAWRSAEIAGIAAASMLLIALIVRRYLQFEARLHARVIALWRPLLTRVAIEAGELPTLPPLADAGTCPYLMEEWNALHDAVRGESSQRLNEIALKLGLDVAARRLIHSRRIGRRILAIRTLGHLRDPSIVEAAAGAARLDECAGVVLRRGRARADRRAARDARHHARSFPSGRAGPARRWPGCSSTPAPTSRASRSAR